MTAPPPVKNHACDACDKLDDHPMVHVWGVWRKNDRTTVNDPSFHFDCLPAEYVDLLGDLPQHANTLATIAAARDGVHGAELHKFIHKQKNNDNLVEPEGHEVVPGVVLEED